MPRAREAEERRLRDLLRQVRLDAGLRQSDVAKRLGRSQSYVSKYESGELQLDFLDVRDVCRAIGIAFADIARSFETGRRPAR